MGNSYTYQIILYYMQVVLKNSLDPYSELLFLPSDSMIMDPKLWLQDCGLPADLRPAGQAGRQLPAQGPGADADHAQECRLYPA